MQVVDYLADHEVAFERLWHPPAYSAQKRAKVLGVPGRSVAKAILLRGPSGYFVVVLAATRQVDLAALSREIGGPVRLAKDHEVADVFRDCEYGVASPFGSIYGVPTVLDAGLSPEAWIVCEGNSKMEAVKLRVRDFERVEQPCRLRLSV